MDRDLNDGILEIFHTVIEASHGPVYGYAIFHSCKSRDFLCDHDNDSYNLPLFNRMQAETVLDDMNRYLNVEISLEELVMFLNEKSEDIEQLNIPPENML